MILKFSCFGVIIKHPYRREVLCVEYLFIWAALLAVSLIIEALTQQLTMIWFAAGALVAVIIALLGGPLWLQCGLFLIVSILLMIFTRPIALKLLMGKKGKTRTNVDAMIGMEAVVVADIDPIQGTGQIKAGGSVWSAKPLNPDDRFTAGDRVVIERVEGVKAVVRPKV